MPEDPSRAQPLPLNILVCVKQVPEADARIDIAPGGRTVTIADAAHRMNRCDACALECAVRIRATAAGPVHIHAVTVGPARAETVLRRAMGLGADQGTHLVCSDEPLRSPRVTVDWLARWAAGRGFGLVLCGTQSEDLMQGVTGPMLAERLGMPAACAVISAAVAEDGRTVAVEKEVENGYRVQMRLRLPALLTIQSGEYVPRYPALSRMLRAAAADIEVARVVPGTAPGQRVVSVAAPAAKTTARFLEGPLVERARALRRLLVQRGLT